MTLPPHCWRDDCEFCAERRRRQALKERARAIWDDAKIGGGGLRWRPGDGWPGTLKESECK